MSQGLTIILLTYNTKDDTCTWLCGDFCCGYYASSLRIYVISLPIPLWVTSSALEQYDHYQCGDSKVTLQDMYKIDQTTTKHHKERTVRIIPWLSWWRHQMETFSALQAFCVGNSLVTGEFPAQRPVTRSFDVFFDLRLNKRLIKQSRRRWFEISPCQLWCHCTVSYILYLLYNV